MEEYAHELQNAHDTTIHLEVDAKVKSVKLDMKKRHELFFIFKEAMRNIAEQANGTPSVINIDLASGNLLLKILNPEAGFYPPVVAETTKQEMKQRALIIGADLEIQSDKNGVSIILVVPVKK